MKKDEQCSDIAITCPQVQILDPIYCMLDDYSLRTDRWTDRRTDRFQQNDIVNITVQNISTILYLCPRL